MSADRPGDGPGDVAALWALVFLAGCLGGGVLAGLAWTALGLPGALTVGLIMLCLSSVALGRDSVPGIDPDRL